MSDLKPDRLHVTFAPDVSLTLMEMPRRYTLTHSDLSGELFLTISQQFNRSQISGWYTRLMRDEVLAEWKSAPHQGSPFLIVHCHVSGGLALGSARWRYNIFNHHMNQVLQSFRYGDRLLIENEPALDKAAVIVQYKARQREFNKAVNWGSVGDYWLGD